MLGKRLDSGSEALGQNVRSRITNWDGKADCFRKLMKAQFQTSGHPGCCPRVSWQCLQFKESLIIITGNIALAT